MLLLNESPNKQDCFETICLECAYCISFVINYLLFI